MTSRHIMMIIWLIIGFAHLKSRKQQTETPAYYVKWLPYTTWFAIVALLAILIIMTTSIVITGITAAIYLLITVAYLVKGRKHQ